MAAKQGGGKKKRTPKTSKGVHGGGGRHRHLTGVELVNMGKGAARIPAFGTRNQSGSGPSAQSADVKGLRR